MKRRPVVSAFCLLATAIAPSLASGADPTTAGTTNIGTHPGYSSGYSALWRSGYDYSVLTDGTNSFFNAPQSNGALYFRGQNVDWASIGANGLNINSGFIRNNTLNVGSDNFVLGLGEHPWYGSSFVGLWMQGNCSNCPTSNYSLLTDGLDTYLNAPRSEGAIWFRIANNNGMRLTSSTFSVYAGTAEKPGGGSWSVYSDARIKKDVRDLHYGLAELEQVRPVTYKYNGLGEMPAGDTEYVGIVAQELERALPFMVTSQKKKMRPGDKELTDIKRVDPSAFTYLLINAVKQLSAENKQMKKLVCMDHPRESFCGGTGVALK
jgi:Chaperone of endosialidase